MLKFIVSVMYGTAVHKIFSEIGILLDFFRYGTGTVTGTGNGHGRHRQ